MIVEAAICQTEYNERMGRRPMILLYVLSLVAVVVLVDVLLFRHHFWERLMANVGIVLIFAAFALRFLRLLTHDQPALLGGLTITWSPLR